MKEVEESIGDDDDSNDDSDDDSEPDKSTGHRGEGQSRRIRAAVLDIVGAN